MWVTRDSVNPKYLVEAGSSLVGQSGTNTTTSSPESQIDEKAPLSPALARSGARGKKGKDPVGNLGKRTRPADDDDASTDDLELQQAKR